VSGDPVGSGVELCRGTEPWTERQKLIGGASEESAFFGSSVVVAGSTISVGSSSDGDGGSDAGAVYVFTREGAGWVQEQKIVPSDLAEDGQFGCTIALDGDTFIVGSCSAVDGTDVGAVYVFTREGAGWVQEQKIVPSDLAEDGQFGHPVALDGDTFIIGSDADDDGGRSSGSAYVFTRNEGSWSLQQKLIAQDAAEGNQFGFSVSVSGDTALVGAIRGDDAVPDAGSAYVFVRNGTLWTLQQQLVATDASEGDGFGWSVVARYDTIVVGTPYRRDRGAAYVFTRVGDFWSEQATLVAGDAEPPSYFGESVSVSGDAVVVGAPSWNFVEYGPGSAHVFAQCAPPGG